MIEHVYVDWGSGWVDLLDYSGVRLVRRSGLQKIQQIHDENCRIARNSVRFRITSNMTLVPHLMDNDEIAVQIEEGGAVWFKGYARPVTTFTDSNNDEVIDFEAFDESWLLEKALQDDELYENAYICDPSDTANSIVHQLLLSAGVASDDIEITTTISQQTTVNFEEGTKYLNAINDLLWDYHCVLSVTDGGKFWVYDWAPEAVPSASQTFDETNTIGELKVTKSDIDEDQVQVHYHQIIERNNITLCKKTYKNVPSNTLFKVLTTEVLHEWDEAREDAQVEDDQSAKNWPSSPGRFKFSNPVEGSEWLTSSNHSVSWHNRRFWNSVFVGIGAGGTTDNGEVSLASSAFGTTYADLQFNIDSPSKPWYASASWNTMRSVTIKGDAQFLKRHVNRTSLIPAGGNVLKEYKANYLYNDADAVALATAMANHLKHGKWHYEWKSQVEVAAGDYARIYNDTTLNIDRVVRIIKATWDEAQRIYSYTAIGVADLGTPVGSVTGEDVVVIAPGEIVDAIGRTTEGLDENGDLTRIVKSTTMPGEDEESVTGVTGLYMTRDFLGFYNGDESVDDWTARIKADGTFKFLGDADNFIEWNGIQLLIQGDLQSANYSTGSDGWKINNSGDADFQSGKIGQWIIDTVLKSALNGARIELDPTKRRISIFNDTEEKVAMGYLEDLPKNDGSGNWGSLDYGFWARKGNKLQIDGTVEQVDGDWVMGKDSSFILSQVSESQSPYLSARRLIFGANEIAVEEYTGASWTRRAQIDVSTGIKTHTLRGNNQLLMYSGEYKDVLDAGYATGRSVPEGGEAFAFEESTKDLSGVDNWNVKTGLAYTTICRYGEHAVTGDGTAGSVLSRTGWIALGKEWTAEWWMRVASESVTEWEQITEVMAGDAGIRLGVLRLEQVYADDGYVDGYFERTITDYSGTMQLSMYSTGKWQHEELPINTLAWSFIGITFDGATLSVVYDNQVYSLGNGLPDVTAKFTFNFSSLLGTIMDMLMVHPTSGLSTSELLDHSTSETGYGSISTTNKMVIFPKSGLLIGGDLEVDGNVGFSKGRSPSGYLYGDLYEDDIFTALSPLIPNINDEILVSGAAGRRYNDSWQMTYHVSKAVRRGVTKISLYGVRVVTGEGPGVIDHTFTVNQGTTDYLWATSLAW